MAVKHRKAGFTVVELLTVLAIIALLTGLLIPAVSMVRSLARNTRQRVQINNIDMALLAFRNDQGYYPPSEWIPVGTGDYCGSQKLAEALLGWDLLGFHPNSAWRADGFDINGFEFSYDPDNIRSGQTLYERRGRYLELDVANAFRLIDQTANSGMPGLFEDTSSSPLAPRYVLCDTFGWRKIPVGDQVSNAGMPILYYRANTTSKQMRPSDVANNIYNFNDNVKIFGLGGRVHPLGVLTTFHSTAGLIDPKAFEASGGVNWPYRPDSYILISAGADGLYGTSDDITNFGN